MIGEFDTDGNPINTYVYLGNHRLAMLGGTLTGSIGCTMGQQAVAGAKANWVVILVVPVVVLLVIRYRRNRLLVGLFVLIGAGAIIMVAMKEARSDMEYSEAIYYYHNDHLGTPQVMTDGTGAIKWDAAYQPFGKINTYATQDIINRHRFPGQYQDDMTGMYYNHHRYYMPEAGRYNRQDSNRQINSFDKVDLTFYNYSFSNPINYLDRFGLRTCRSGRCPDCESGIWRPWRYFRPNYAEAGAGFGMRDFLSGFGAGLAGSTYTVYCHSNTNLSKTVASGGWLLGFQTDSTRASFAGFGAGYIICFADCLEDFESLSFGASAGLRAYRGLGGSLGGSSTWQAVCLYITLGYGAGTFMGYNPSGGITAD